MKLYEITGALNDNVICETICCDMHDVLSEGVISDIRSSIGSVLDVAKTVFNSRNSKGTLNDNHLRSMYEKELKDLSILIDTLPAKAQPIVKRFCTEKLNIKFSGVDLSRENVKRILQIKLLKTVLFIIDKFSNVDELIVSAISFALGGPIGALIGMVLNAKDYAEAASKIAGLGKEISSVNKKVKELQSRDNNQ